MTDQVQGILLLLCCCGAPLVFVAWRLWLSARHRRDVPFYQPKEYGQEQRQPAAPTAWETRLTGMDWFRWKQYQSAKRALERADASLIGTFRTREDYARLANLAGRVADLREGKTDVDIPTGGRPEQEPTELSILARLAQDQASQDQPTVYDATEHPLFRKAAKK